MESAWPVAITTLGGAAAASMTWRRGAKLEVTVVVKGTFAFVPDHVMTPVPALPILVAEQDGGPGVGLRDVSDLAPYLAQTDVWLTGRAIARRGHAARFLEVRLALVRDGAAIFDKTVELDARSATSAARPGVAAELSVPAMGPLSRSWPIRRRLLGAADPGRLEGVAISVPESFDWSYFQAAPVDQRTGPLRGDEWLVLDGVHPTLARIQTQLPGARAAARLYGSMPGGFRALALVLDTIRVDVDRRRCALSWRGHFPVTSEQVLSSLSVVAGIELPGRPLTWPVPVAPEEAAPLEAEVDDLAGTLWLDDRSPGSAAQPEGGDPLGGTLALGDISFAELAHRPATPFVEPSQATPLPAPHRAGPGAAARDLMGGTVGIDELLFSAIATRPATPFEDPLGGTLELEEAADDDPELRPQVPFSGDGQRPTTSPGAPDRLAGTLGLDEMTEAELTARPATPFRAGVASLPPPRGFVDAPARERAPDDLLGGTVGLDEETIAELIARPATPFELPAWTARPDAGAMPAGLGAQFLFAMAALESSEQVGPRPKHRA